MKVKDMFCNNGGMFIYKAWVFSRDNVNNDIDSLQVNVDGDNFAFDVNSAITQTLLEKFNAEAWPDTNKMIEDVKNSVITILTIELNSDNIDDDVDSFISNFDPIKQTATIAVKGKIKNCNCSNFNVTDIVIEITDTGFIVKDIALETIALNQA